MKKSKEEHIKDIAELIDTIEAARIFAGAEFESLCNEKNYVKAELFCMVRDQLQAQATVLKDYLIILPNEEPEKLEAEWIHTEECDEEFSYRCSNCNMPSRSNNHHFCSQCGADMYAIGIRKRSLNNDK